MLKSYLGEPLLVKLTVSDVEKSPDPSCFSVSDTNDIPAFKKAATSVTTNKDDFQLTITTQSIISEPILNLRVSYHCDPHLSRDYVLLLDPRETSTPALQTGDTHKPARESSDRSNLAGLSDSDNLSTASSATARPTKKTAKAKKLKSQSSNASRNRDGAGNGAGIDKSSINTSNANSSSVDDKITAAYTGKLQSATQPVATEKSSLKPNAEGKPYLSISGGSHTPTTADGQLHLSLKFETALDTNRASTIAPVDSTDMMDEVTVMSNRLSHLEKQIANLQAQNAQLKMEATLAKNAAEHPSAGWINYVLMALGAALLLAALEWARRLWLARRTIQPELSWLDADAATDTDNEPSFTASVPSFMERKSATEASTSFLDAQPFDDEAFDDTQRIEPTKSGTLSFTEQVSEEHDSIIDNADVFIEHERPLLAIQLLQNHLHDFPTESPKVWLKLISLIAAHGTAEEYEVTAIEANKHFNIRVPEYAEANTPDLSSIENFATVVARLEGVWGSPFAVKFLNDLIYDQYAQPAEGFSAYNFEELFFLKKVAELLSTGVSTNQRTLYRAAAAAAAGTTNSAATGSLDSFAFNEATFGNDLSLDETVSPSIAEARTSAANMDAGNDFSNAPTLDMPQATDAPQTQHNRLSREEAYSQFENSAFQKVPSYDVDMLTDFDEQLDAEIPIWRNTHTSTSTAPPPNSAEDNADRTGNDDLNFPLDVYPEETPAENPAKQDAPQDNNQASKSNGKPDPNKDDDSNIIEWDLPSWTLK